MSDTLFDLSQYKSASAKSYHSDYIDATGTDPAWDESSLAAIPALGMDELATEVADHWQSCAEFTITLASGQTVQGIFLPGLEGELRMHQFDFTGSVSPTGFKSHFVLAVEAEKFSHPCDYAQAYVPDLVAWFEASQQQAKSKKRSRSVAKAQATQGQATENDDSRQQTIMAEDKTPELNHATVEVVEELTEQEEAERHRLELKVERSFLEAGLALRELRDRRLYRNTHKTFEAYCQDRFGFGRAHSYRLIDAVTVVENLRFAEDEKDALSPIRRQILPTKLEQVRPLTGLEPEEQREVWQQAVEQADGKVPAGRTVKSIVERLKAKQLTKAADFCVEGDVFTLTRLVEQERKYNGCWAIAIGVNDFTVKVEVHDALLTVKPENLNPIDSADVRRQLPPILNRIKRLRESGFLDRGAYNVLEDLGRHTYLTEVESGLLSWLENHYGLNHHGTDSHHS